MTIRTSGPGLIIHQPLSSDLLLEHAHGTMTSAGGGAWETVVTTDVTLNGIQDVHITAAFSATTATGAAAAYDATFRILIDGVASDEFPRTLSGSDDKGLGAALAHAPNKQGTITIELQIQDDASHTVEVLAGEMHIFAR